jgi:hypothetical protein
MEGRMNKLIEKIMKEDIYGDEGHEGWKNQATWGAALIIDNDQSLQEEVLSIAKESMQVQGDDMDKVIDFEDKIRDFVENIIEDETTKVGEMGSQLMNIALGQIDWREMAEHFMGKAKEIG